MHHEYDSLSTQDLRLHWNPNQSCVQIGNRTRVNCVEVQSSNHSAKNTLQVINNTQQDTHSQLIKASVILQVKFLPRRKIFGFKYFAIIALEVLLYNKLMVCTTTRSSLINSILFYYTEVILLFFHPRQVIALELLWILSASFGFINLSGWEPLTSLSCDGQQTVHNVLTIWTQVT